jgi:hypothetical protein
MLSISTWCDGVKSTLQDIFNLVWLAIASISAFIIARSPSEVVERMADRIGGAELIAWGKALSDSLHASIRENRKGLLLKGEISR